MILGLGGPEILVVLVDVLVIFGPKNLPKLGSALGKTVKNVREGMEGDDEEPAKAIADKADEAVAEAPEVVEDASEVVEEDVQFCSKCGAKNAADAGFCNKCGAKLG
jgi:sec-independent protein translocase protein TatA